MSRTSFLVHSALLNSLALSLLFFFFLATWHSLWWILVSRPVTSQTLTSAVKAGSPNHRTAREFLLALLSQTSRAGHSGFCPSHGSHALVFFAGLYFQFRPGGTGEVIPTPSLAPGEAAHDLNQLIRVTAIGSRISIQPSHSQ